MLSLNRFLKTLSLSESQISLAFLSVIVGLLSGGAVTLIYIAIDTPLTLWFMPDAESFEELDVLTRCLLLITSATVLLTAFSFIKPLSRSVGIAHVIEYVSTNRLYLPLKNVFAQSFGVVVALIGGFSVGREGPAVHVGAGIGSLTGQSVHSAHHRSLILIGCGVASAIAAAFNTPMAGVIFAMEVVLMHYDKHAFIPIILSSVIGALITQVSFGDTPVFEIPQFELHSLYEIPGVILLGALCGITSAMLLKTIRSLSPVKQWPLWLQWGILTLATLLISIPYPQVMGIGYDTVNLVMHDFVPIKLLLILFACKLLLLSWSAATRFPAGSIAPLLFVGAVLGGALGEFSELMWPEINISHGIFVMLGMGAMMGATLGAPLAALVALLELTYNPNVIWPAMLAIVVATLTRSSIFKQNSLFNTQRTTSEQHHRHQIQQALRASWISLVIEPAKEVSATISLGQARSLLSSNTRWFLIKKLDLILPAQALQARIDEVCNMETPPDLIDLMTLSEHHHRAGRANVRVNFQDALTVMENQDVRWLSVWGNNQQTCIGVVSQTRIHQFLTQS